VNTPLGGKNLFRAKLRLIGAWREFFMGVGFFQGGEGPKTVRPGASGCQERSLFQPELRGIKDEIIFTRSNCVGLQGDLMIFFGF
jgi:hypothetical protein